MPPHHLLLSASLHTSNSRATVADVEWRTAWKCGCSIQFLAHYVMFPKSLSFINISISTKLCTCYWDYYYYTARLWYPEDMIIFTPRSESSTPRSVFSLLFWARITKSERVVKQSREMQVFHYANLVHIFGISPFPPDGMRSRRTHKCAKNQQVFQAVINSRRKGLRNRHTYACYGWDWNLNLWFKKKKTTTTS